MTAERFASAGEEWCLPNHSWRDSSDEQVRLIDIAVIRSCCRQADRSSPSPSCQIQQHSTSTPTQQSTRVRLPGPLRPSVRPSVLTSETPPGRTAIQRLLQVAKLSPAQRTRHAALAAALEIIKRETIDTDLYHVVRAQLEGVASRMTNGEAATAAAAPIVDADDEAWPTRTAEAAKRTTDKLDAELRNYSLNMIKESTRQTLLAIARHERARGDLGAAGRTLGKVRDYQSGPEHELETYVSVIEVALAEGAYGVVLPTVIKAQHALGRLASSVPSGGAGVWTGEQIRERERRQKVVEGVTAQTGAKLAFAKGCALVATGQWEAGVRELTAVRERLGEWEGAVRLSVSCHTRSLTARQIFSLSDVAMYTSLAALATLPRAQLKTLVLDNPHVRYTMDHGGAPWTRQVVEAFVSARYATVLQLLEAYKVRRIWRA